MNESQRDNSLGFHGFGADVSITVTGLDKPIRTVGRGVKRMFGLSKKNVNKLAKAVALRTE